MENNILKRFIIISMVLSFAACKQKDHFQLKGTVKYADTDIAHLGMSSGFIIGDFSNFKLENDENYVSNEGFEIQGTLTYPHAFRFITDTGEISGLFFIDPNDGQSVVIDTLGIHRNIIVGNSATNEEYLNDYLPLLKDLNEEHNRLKDQWADTITDESKEAIQRSTQEILKRKDEVLLRYIKDNPNSFVGMWVLAENFSIYGYKQLYETAYDYLSGSIKGTPSGMQLKEKLAVAGISGLNGSLPGASLYEYGKGDETISFTNLASKYTLVDFWGSFCAPCIRAFPKIKSIYDSTDREYFDVLAISVDPDNKTSDWKAFIEENPYTWRQFLDKEARYSKMLMINSVPANFLLDAKGTILMKNFSPEELEEFLNDL